MEGVKHPSKCFQQAGPPVVWPFRTADQLLGIAFSEGKWCFGLIALVQQPRMSKTLTSAEDLTVTFILFVFSSVWLVSFPCWRHVTINKATFLSSCVKWTFLLASRVGLKAFFKIWRLYSDGLPATAPQFRLRYRSRHLIYTMLWRW